MMEIRGTKTFVKWLDKLRDIRARAHVLVRIKRLADGNPGDVTSVDIREKHTGNVADQLSTVRGSNEIYRAYRVDSTWAERRLAK